MVQTIAQHSPFKFLDSYGREDRAIFFGREEEINALYELMMSSQLTLVYGASGTGKTSLIECGLSNRFSETDWFAVRIRRCDDITASTFQAIRDRSYPDKVIADTETSLFNAVQALYIFYYIPIYLIFDQFEELFISGTPEEQEIFFTQLKTILDSGKPCKVILIMREEYIAYLSQFEDIIPTLFNAKFRVEKMNQRKLQAVVLGTIQTPQYNIIFEEPEKNARSIIENLRNERREVDLTNLQVYLDRLYSEDVKRMEEHGETRPITFDSVLIEEKVGKLPQVLSDFLEEQMTVVDKILAYPDISLAVLTAFVTNDGTKQSRHNDELIEELHTAKNIPPSLSNACIQKFYERRILRELKIGDELQYEITHDLLAHQIYSRFTAEEKGLRKATSMIQNAYDFHAELSKKGEGISFMTEEQLSYLQNILPRLTLNETLLSFIEDSKAAITEEKEKEKLMLQKEVALQKQQLEQEQKSQALQQALIEQERREHTKKQEEALKEREQARLDLKRQQKRSLVSLIVGLVMFGLAIWAIIGFSQVKEQKKKVDEKNEEIAGLLEDFEKKNIQLEKAQKNILAAEEARKKILYDGFIKNGDTKAAVKQYEAAIVEYQGAIRIDNKDEINVTKRIKECEDKHQKQIIQVNLQKHFKDLIRQGSTILDAETKKQNQLLLPEEYLNAQSIFTDAEKLVSETTDEKDKIEMTERMAEKKEELRSRMNKAFKAYTDKAQRFRKVKGWKEALTNYNKALLLQPNDEQTLKDMKECESK